MNCEKNISSTIGITDTARYEKYRGFADLRYNNECIPGIGLPKLEKYLSTFLLSMAEDF